MLEKRERKQEKKAARLAAAEAGLYDPETGETIDRPAEAEAEAEADPAAEAEVEVEAKS
ncbi:MAG: hypothetical protein M3540_08455 [Actinomycetota bacterium]|nr:hypothetical protein [Actinomycetota bacterium]